MLTRSKRSSSAQGRESARKVVFDVLGKWREGYGDGVASLIVQRNGDASRIP